MLAGRPQRRTAFRVCGQRKRVSTRRISSSTRPKSQPFGNHIRGRHHFSSALQSNWITFSAPSPAQHASNQSP